jgi:hypothetical protein
MTIPISFYYYLKYNEDSYDIQLFYKTFENKLSFLPKNIISSKKIIKILEIQSNIQFEIFTNVFNQYYIFKLLS